jgi:hypothetical protein
MDKERKALQKSLDLQQRSREAIQECEKALAHRMKMLDAKERKLERSLKAAHGVSPQ